MNVLCVNHTGEVSGAERSLLDLMSGLRDDLNVRLACPMSGPLAGAAREPGDSGRSDSRDRGQPQAAPSPHAARRLADDGGGHGHPPPRPPNAGRCRARELDPSRPVQRVRRSNVTGADRSPRSRSPPALAGGRRIAQVDRGWRRRGCRQLGVHRGGCPSGERPRESPCCLQPGRSCPVRLEPRRPRSRRGHAWACPPRRSSPRSIGQITPWKGQLDAVRTLARVRSSGRDVHLLIVGEPKFVSAATRYDNRAYHAELQRVIAAEGAAGPGPSARRARRRARDHGIARRSARSLVGGAVRPRGRGGDGDGTAGPGHARGGPAEIIHDDVDGILLPPRKPEAWAETLIRVMSPRMSASGSAAPLGGGRAISLWTLTSARCARCTRKRCARGESD